MSKLDQLAELGQSIWLDYIRRSLMESGGLQDRIDAGVRGVTSNPSIFEKAIAGSDDYDPQLEELAKAGKNLREIYESLVITDIQQACDLFRPVYDRSDGLDGYVSLEASPSLAEDTEGTIEEVAHFHEAVDRPNLMIKIPATKAGYPAVEEMLSRGVNINITLMFSLEQYEQVAAAYLNGLERFQQAGGDPAELASVASFFVSRVDSKVDPLLDERGQESLRGAIGIANAKLAYRRFTEVFSGPRWAKLAAAGARVQRVLWGSTSTKDPRYPDTLYVDNLIGPHTVNTVPPKTLDAYLDHGTLAPTLQRNVDLAEGQLEELQSIGIEFDVVTDELLAEGLTKFSDAFDALMASIESKAKRLAGPLPAEAGD